MTERFDGSRLLVAVGAIALLVSLFLDWYGPGDLGLGSAITAWTAFEITDILLAAIALAALAGAVAAIAPESRLPETPSYAPPILGGAAFVLVAVNLIDVPPAASGASLETGAWIALAGSALMLIGGILSITRISLVVTLAPREASAAGGTAADEEDILDDPPPYDVEDVGSEAIGAEDTQTLPADDRR
jgi:hypothetical protein